MKIAESLGMTISKTVSFWFTLVLLALVAPALAYAQTSTVVTGYTKDDALPPQGSTQTGAGQTSGVVPPRMFVPDPNLPYPNISKSLTDAAEDKDPANAEQASKAQQILQMMQGFGQSDYQRPAQSGYSEDGNGNQTYKYNPNGHENDPEVDNSFPQTCDLKDQAIPLNPRGVTAESLLGHQCSPRDDRLTCMVCNLFHEAANEVPKGQLAVAQNVMTRVFNGKYPDTVCKTVWEHKQYSWTWLYSGDKLKLPHTNRAKLEHLIKVAKEGMCLGPNGFTNYYNPAAAKPKWGPACMNSKHEEKIGNHQFCAIGPSKVTRTMQEVAAAEGLKPIKFDRITHDNTGMQ